MLLGREPQSVNVILCHRGRATGIQPRDPRSPRVQVTFSYLSALYPPAPSVSASLFILGSRAVFSTKRLRARPTNEIVRPLFFFHPHSEISNPDEPCSPPSPRWRVNLSTAGGESGTAIYRVLLVCGHVPSPTGYVCFSRGS